MFGSHEFIVVLVVWIFRLFLSFEGVFETRLSGSQSLLLACAQRTICMAPEIGLGLAVCKASALIPYYLYGHLNLLLINFLGKAQTEIEYCYLSIYTHIFYQAIY